MTALTVALTAEAHVYRGEDHLLPSSNRFGGPSSTLLGTPRTRLQDTYVLLSLGGALSVVAWQMNS